MGQITLPAVQNSDMPGLLGRMALRKNRAVWGFFTDQLHFLGPGDYDLSKAFPPGTDTYQLEHAPSGHSVLPCCEYSGTASSSSDSSLTLVTRMRAGYGGTVHWEECPAFPIRTPPPAEPPVLPAMAQRSAEMMPPPATEPGAGL